MAAHNKANEAYTTWEKRRFRPGDVHAAGKDIPNTFDVEMLTPGLSTSPLS